MGIDASAVARVVGIDTKFQDLRSGNIAFLPQRIAVIGQGASSVSYDTTKAQYTSASAVGSTYGFGSPLHLVVDRLLPVNGDGVGTIPVTVYPLEDDVSSVESSGDITPGGSPTEAAAYRVSVNEILSEEFVIAVGDSVATVVTAMTGAINAVLGMPVIATDNTTDVGLESKWKGESANDIFVEVRGSTTAGNTFAVTQMTGGLVNPDVDDALAQVGNVWETIILNCLNISDTVTLDKYQVFGDGRRGQLVKSHLCGVFTGNTEVDVAAATAISDARKTDLINSQLVAPGSNNLPFVVAARQTARIAALANNNPPHDYGSQDATGLVPGTDGEQWNYLQRDQAVKAGSSTVEVKNGVVNISDVVTFYHPVGDPIPAYRYVVDNVKVANIIFNLRLLFENADWDGAPLVPDDQPAAGNPTAKSPKDAVGAVNAMIDSLANAAIISDPKFAKANTFAAIDPGNPKRLNVSLTVKLSGNANIISIDFNFGFAFGSMAVA